MVDSSQPHGPLGQPIVCQPAPAVTMLQRVFSAESPPSLVSTVPVPSLVPGPTATPSMNAAVVVLRPTTRATPTSQDLPTARAATSGSSGGGGQSTPSSPCGLYSVLPLSQQQPQQGVAATSLLAEGATPNPAMPLHGPPSSGLGVSSSACPALQPGSSPAAAVVVALDAPHAATTAPGTGPLLVASIPAALTLSHSSHSLAGASSPVTSASPASPASSSAAGGGGGSSQGTDTRTRPAGPSGTPAVRAYNWTAEKRSCSVFFARVPPSVPEEEVEQVFAAAGTITEFQLYRTFVKCRVSKGCGVVSYSTPAVAEQAIQLLNGRQVWPAARHPLFVTAVKSVDQLPAGAGGSKPRGGKQTKAAAARPGQDSHIAALLQQMALTGRQAGRGLPDAAGARDCSRLQLVPAGRGGSPHAPQLMPAWAPAGQPQQVASVRWAGSHLGPGSGAAAVVAGSNQEAWRSANSSTGGAGYAQPAGVVVAGGAGVAPQGQVAMLVAAPQQPPGMVTVVQVPAGAMLAHPGQPVGAAGGAHGSAGGLLAAGMPAGSAPTPVGVAPVQTSQGMPYLQAAPRWVQGQSQWQQVPAGTGWVQVHGAPGQQQVVLLPVAAAPEHWGGGTHLVPMMPAHQQQLAGWSSGMAVVVAPGSLAFPAQAGWHVAAPGGVAVGQEGSMPGPPQVQQWGPMM